MEADIYHRTVLAVLSKRYRLRVRQIRNRRKMTHQIMIQKYVQYMQASQRLFQTYAMRVLELFEPETVRRKNNKVTESWWIHQFPNLSDAKFLKTFHVSRKFYNYLCQQLSCELKPLPNKIALFYGTSVEKQVALGLYKLASGESYKKTSQMVGVNHSTVHKLLLKFLKAILRKFGDTVSIPSRDQCKELALTNPLSTNANAVIGSLLKKNFQTRTNSSARQITLMGIVDLNKRIRFVRTETADTISSYCENLKSICFPPSDLSADKSPNFFIITDDNVPDYDCFIQKTLFDNMKNAEDFENIKKFLEVKEAAFSMLIGRWGGLKKDMDYLSPMANLVLIAATCLHNLCIDMGETNINF